MTTRTSEGDRRTVGALTRPLAPSRDPDEDDDPRHHGSRRDTCVYGDINTERERL